MSKLDKAKEKIAILKFWLSSDWVEHYKLLKNTHIALTIKLFCYAYSKCSYNPFVKVNK